MKKIGVILPCFNEVIVKIKELIEKQISNLNMNFDLIFIDDGSLDNSVEIITSLISVNKNINITLLKLHFNMGHQKAIYQGLLEIDKKNYDNVIIMDSDGEDDPAAITEMIKHRHLDLVNIVRGKRSENMFFRLNYLIYKNLYKLLIGKVINSGNFTLISKKLVKSLVENNFIHLAAFLNNQRCEKYDIVWDRNKRIDGESKMNFKSLFYHGINSLIENAQNLLFFFIKLLIGLTIVIFVIIGIVIYKKYIIEVAIPGWSSSLLTSLSNSILICITIFILGALQLNILNKQNSAKKHPLYRKYIIVKNW